MTTARWLLCAWLLIGIYSNRQVAMLFEAFPTQDACEETLARNSGKDWTDLVQLACVREGDTRVYVLPGEGTTWETPPPEKKQ